MSSVIFNAGESLDSDKLQAMVDEDLRLYNLLQRTAWGNRKQYFGSVTGSSTSYTALAGNFPGKYYTEANRLLLASFELSAFTDGAFTYSSNYTMQLKINGTAKFEYQSGLIKAINTGSNESYESNGQMRMIISGLSQGSHTIDCYVKSSIAHANDSIACQVTIEDVGMYIAPQ